MLLRSIPKQLNITINELPPYDIKGNVTPETYPLEMSKIFSEITNFLVKKPRKFMKNVSSIT